MYSSWIVFSKKPITYGENEHCRTHTSRRNDLKTTNVVNIEDNMSFHFLIDKQATLFAYLWVWDKDRDTLVLVHWMYLTLFVLLSTVFVHAVRHTVNIPLTLLFKLNTLSTALIPSILYYYTVIKLIQMALETMRYKCNETCGIPIKMKKYLSDIM